jgi:hypothetical protein
MAGEEPSEDRYRWVALASTTAAVFLSQLGSGHPGRAGPHRQPEPSLVLGLDGEEAPGDIDGIGGGVTRQQLGLAAQGGNASPSGVLGDGHQSIRQDRQSWRARLGATRGGSSGILG